MSPGPIFYQLFESESSTYTYLLGDEKSAEAIIIDPVLEMAERDLKLIHELGFKLKYILETHLHADHISGSGELRQRTGGKVGVSSFYGVACADLQLEEGQTLTFGPHTVSVLHTPGHTHGCLTYQVGPRIFTGDTLLIRGCGRTDFQEGSSEKLFESVREKLFHLSNDTMVYPAHDYKGQTKTTIALEKKWNARLNETISKEEFISIMANLNLPQPKKIHEAIEANFQCGLTAKVL